VGELEDENAVVTFAASAYERSLYEPLIEAFNEQFAPLSVQFVELPEFTPDQEVPDNYFRHLATAADTSLVYAGAAGIGQYFRDLQPLLESDPSFESEDFWPRLLDGCLDVEGRMVGIPLNASVNGIFYDEAAFKQAGLPLPGPGWTLDDLSKAAESLAREQGDARRYGLAEQGQLWTSVAGPVVDMHLLDTGGEPDAEALLDSLQWYIDLVEKEAIYTFTETENWERQWQDWENLFKTENRPAMWGGDLGTFIPGAEWSPSEDDPFANSALNHYSFAPYPVSSDGSLTDTSMMWVQCAGISAGALNPRAAWTWLAFLSRQDLVRDRTQAYEVSRVPARQSVAEETGYWSALPDQAGPAVRFALDHAWFGPLYPEAFGAVEGALRKALSGQGDFAEELAASLAQMESTPEPTPDSVAVTVATPRPTLSAGTVVIDFFMSIYGVDAAKLKAEIETYQQEHPGVAIELETEMSGPVEDVEAYITGKYDCFSWYPMYGQEGQPADLLNLTSFFQAEGADFTGDFSTEMLDQFRVQDVLYGLPAYSQPQVMAYNRDLLEKRGLEPPALDWTFDDFLALIAAVASTKEGDESYGYLSNGYEDLLLRGRGVSSFDLSQDPPVAMFDSPEMLSAIEWLQDQQKNNTLLIQSQDNWATVQEAMSSGKLAFWATQAGNEAWMFSGPGTTPPHAIGVIPLPSVPDPTASIYWNSTQGYFISGQADHPEACWDWIRYLSDQAEAFSGVPARRSLAESSNWEAIVGPEKAEAYRAAVSMTTIPLEMDQSAIGWPFYNWQYQVFSAVLEGADPQQSLSEAQQKAEAYLACMAEVDTSGLSGEAMYTQANSCARQADPAGNW
jgi:ABC-type glycerol-3-phosphate transport system substrate-binding protein